MTKHVTPTDLRASGIASDETEYVLSILRIMSMRLGLIRDEINDIGIALKNGRIGPEHARALADQAAPGCYETCAGGGNEH